MKNIHYLLIFLFPFLGNAQLTDTTCVQSRWIALKQSTVNKDIFQLDASLDKSLDMVFTIKRLVEDSKLRIYTQNDGSYETKGWYYINYKRELENNLRDSLIRHKNPYFEISYQLDIPLTNIYGEDSITIEQGMYLTVYPEPISYVFPARECDEIRIKEERFYNERTKKYEFNPVGLSFYFKWGNDNRGHEKFWVDLNELFTALENKNQYSWYTAIVNKKYQGFQYMQTSCSDDFIRE